MKTISMEEILSLYKKCGVSAQGTKEIRTDINTGTLNNRLNVPVGVLGTVANNIIYSNGTMTNSNVKM